MALGLDDQALHLHDDQCNVIFRVLATTVGIEAGDDRIDDVGGAAISDLADYGP